MFSIKKRQRFRGHRKILQVTTEIRIKEISSKHSFIQIAGQEWKIQVHVVNVYKINKYLSCVGST